MSDKETAERIVEDWLSGRRGYEIYGNALEIRDTIAAALAAEREACAKVADDRAEQLIDLRDGIATDQRARRMNLEDSARAVSATATAIRNRGD